MIATKSTRILIAEDDHTFRQALSSYLRQDHREILLARDGREAVDILVGDSHIDIFVTELNLPGGEGLRIVKRALERTPQILVILMTSYNFIKDAVAAMKEGAFDYKTKPLLLEEMELAVHRCEMHRALIEELDDLRRQRDEMCDSMDRLRQELESLSKPASDGGLEGAQICIPSAHLKRRNTMEAFLTYRQKEAERKIGEELQLLHKLMGKGAITEEQYNLLKKRVSPHEDIIS